MANLNIAVQVVANVGNAAKNFGGLKQSLTELKSGLDLAGQALAAGQKVIDATVGPTVELATQQRDLARVTGMTAEEAGAMIQATDDMGVSYQTLQTAAEKLNAEGLSLNAENLRSLRAEYQAIPDPVGRAEFATDKFGKAAGPELQKVLEASGAEFESFMASAKDSALVLSTQNVAAAREYELAQDALNDATAEWRVEAGTRLMPVLTTTFNFLANEAPEALDNMVAGVTGLIAKFSILGPLTGGQLGTITGVTDAWDKAATSLDQLGVITAYYTTRLEVATGQTTEGEAATRLQALAWQDATLSEEQLAQATIDATTALDAHERAATAATTATENLTTAHYGNVTATDLLEASTQRYSAAALFKNASENMSAEAAIALGVEMGVLDSKMLIATAALDKLKEKYDADRDGAISAAEAAAGYSQAVLDLHSNIEALPETTTTNVVTNFITTGGSGPGSSIGGTGAIGFAAGGISTGPESGHWELLHGREAVIPLPEGGRVPVELSGAGAPIMINVDARGATDAAAVEAAGYRGAARALRESGVRAQIKLRTGGR